MIIGRRRYGWRLTIWVVEASELNIPHFAALADGAHVSET
jgi:hypothetical protein